MYLDVTTCWRDEPSQHCHQRGLSSTVMANERCDLSFTNVKCKSYACRLTTRRYNQTKTKTYWSGSINSYLCIKYRCSWKTQWQLSPFMILLYSKVENSEHIWLATYRSDVAMKLAIFRNERASCGHRLQRLQLKVRDHSHSQSVACLEVIWSSWAKSDLGLELLI